MGTVKAVTLILYLLPLLAALGCGGLPVDSPDTAPDAALVRVGGATYAVDVAEQPEDRRQGLSGRESLAQDAGMLFVFEQAQPRTFWMKDMRFPLDIIWIDGQCRLLEVAANVPTPPPGAANDAIPRVHSPSPARYVLELNAGEASRAGLSAGHRVEFLGAIAGQHGC